MGRASIRRRALSNAIAATSRAAAPSTSPAPTLRVSPSSPGSNVEVPFQPRLDFPLPTSVPSWYAGHMHRAMRSLPTLLARSPPPLIIEARDSRLPITSINPAFETLFKETFGGSQSGKGKAGADLWGSAPPPSPPPAGDVNNWENRRLVVYTKSDLVDKKIKEPLRKAFLEHGQGQQVLFCDTRVDSEVRQVLKWIHQQARSLLANPPASPKMTRQMARTQRQLSGAFKHTPTPEDGVRLVILGMPNVGKSSLLNALRRVGTGKGKAASTAPQPGHTRKLTGTVRITRDVVKTQEKDDSEKRGPNGEVFTLGRGSADNSSKSSPAASSPPIYVYDTPGVMVPFLGHGRAGAEKGVKLAVAAGIKSSLFDVQGLADYLLYRLNLKHAWQLKKWMRHAQDITHIGGQPSVVPRPTYLTHLPMPSKVDLHATNEIEQLLQWASEKAPGTMLKGGERDWDATAEFILQRWREGKLGPGELDLGIDEVQGGAAIRASPGWGPSHIDGEGLHDRIDRMVREHFEGVQEARDAGVNVPAWKRQRNIAQEAEQSLEDVNGLQNDRDRNHDQDEDDQSLPESTTHFAAPSATPSSHSPRQRHALLSTNQMRKRAKIDLDRERRERLRERGLLSDDTKQDAVRRARELHKRWLVRTGKLKVKGGPLRKLRARK